MARHIPFLATIAAAALMHAGLAIEVTTDCGLVSGQSDPMLGYSFLGIPYAPKPVGALRWTRSNLLSESAGQCWKGTYKASNQSDRCAQNPVLNNGTLTFTGSEDCLTLDVW